ncbi:hypothetical protein ACIVBQ_003059 [Tenacibaculum discolor]
MKKIILLTILLYNLTNEVKAQFSINNDNITFELAKNTVQEHNKPYKFYIKYKVIRPEGSDEYFNNSVIKYFDYLIYGENEYYMSSTNDDEKGRHYTFNRISKVNTGGNDIYTYKSELIDLSTFTYNGKTFPEGNFKFTIVGIIPSSGHRPAAEWDSNGDLISGITNGVKVFSINDICTDCNNGIFIDTDSDGDGVYDNEDECRYEAGSKSNNGCPKPDFKFEEVFITSACGDCRPRLKDLGSKRHIVYRYGLELNINEVLVLNSGGKSTKPTEIKYYYSLNNSLGDSDIPFTISTSVSTINSNTIRKVSQIIDGNDFKTEGMPYGNVYIIGKIDPDNKIEEVDESNNTFVIPITFKESPTSSKISSVNYNLKESSIEKPYKLDVYDINGNYKKSFLIENKSNENNIINEAGLRGIHILKTTRTTKKVLLK